jgi:hypothetical protein
MNQFESPTVVAMCWTVEFPTAWRGIVAEAPLRQHHLYVTGWVEGGLAYGVYRRNTSVIRDGRKVARAKGVKNKAFRWESPVPVTGAQAAAITALAALTLLPEGESGIRLAALPGTIKLLQRYGGNPARSLLPVLAPWDISPVVRELLQSAKLHADSTLTLSPPHYMPRLDERLIAGRLLKNAHSVAANPAPESTFIAPGSWVADFSGATGGEIGLAAIFRSGSDRPVETFPVPGFSTSQHGELVAVLIAHMRGRLAGDKEPVVFNDYKDLDHLLQSHLDGSAQHCGTACGELMQAMGLDEVRRVRAGWTGRNSRLVRHVDRAARRVRRNMQTQGSQLALAEVPWQRVLADARTLALRPLSGEDRASLDAR